MAVKIRLKKMGRAHRPFYRVCAMDSRSPRDGRVIEQLGTYDVSVPLTDARAILKGDRIAYWLSVGAQPSPKVGTLIKKYGLEGTHLEAQKEAISKLSDRRGKAIEAARVAAASVEMPKPEAPTPEPEAEAKPAEGEAKADEAKADDKAEAKADDKAEAKTEDKAEAKKEEKAEAKSEAKADAPAEAAPEAAAE